MYLYLPNVFVFVQCICICLMYLYLYNVFVITIGRIQLITVHCSCFEVLQNLSTLYSNLDKGSVECSVIEIHSFKKGRRQFLDAVKTLMPCVSTCHQMQPLQHITVQHTVLLKVMHNNKCGVLDILLCKEQIYVIRS